MVRLIEQALRAPIEALGFIGQYGGIVRAVTIPQEIGDGQYAGKTFPVSCYLSASDCFDSGKFMDLVPDERYASVAYFEQLGGASLAASGPNRREWAFEEQLRFVCWLNYPALGLDDCLGPERFALAFLAAVDGTRNFTVDGISGRLDITRARLLPRDNMQVFGRYSYAGKQHVFFSPYDFFAVDLVAKATVNGACIQDVTLGIPVECTVTYT